MKLILISLFFTATITHAQYAIDWFTIDGGGGASSGGPYALTGTISQPDAATSSGGGYLLQGGFWSGFVPQEVGPALRIFFSGEKMILAWPNPSTGFQLQESPSLAAINWTNVNDVPTVVGGEKQLSQPFASGSRFYRLRKP